MMAKETTGGLSAVSDDTTDTPAAGGLQGASTINIGGQKISTKGPLQGQALLDAMQEEYSRRVPDSNLGRFNTFLEGMKDAVAITSRDPGSAMAARDQEKRLRDESLFQMRANMATLRGQMAQQAQTNAMMTGAGQAGAAQTGAPQGGGSPVEQMINALPPSLQGQARRLAAEGQFDVLAKMVQDFETKKPELQKNMEFINAMPEGPEKERMRRQVQDKTFAPYEEYNDKGELIKYTLGGPNDPAMAAQRKPPAAPAAPAAPMAAAPAAPAPAPAAPAIKPVAQAPAMPAQAPAQVSPPAQAPKPMGGANVAPQPSSLSRETPNAALAQQVAGSAPFNAKAPVAGQTDDTGFPNTATIGTQDYATQRAKNLATATELQKAGAQSQINIDEAKAKSDIDVAAEIDKASNKIYGEQYAKVPEQKDAAKTAIGAADRIIGMADDPTYKKLMGYFNGGNKAASFLVGALTNVPGHLFDKDKLESAMVALNFNEKERDKFTQLKTDAASLGIKFTADMFHGARLGIGLEKLGSQGKGVSSDFTPETNKLYAQITKDNALFVLEGHRTFRDEWAPQHPGKTWGDFIQSREYDRMLDKHLDAQRALTANTPIKVKKLSVGEAENSIKSSSPSGSILDKYKIRK